MDRRFPRRILALAPGTKHLGVALIENGEPVRFGVKTFKGRKNPREFPAVFGRYVQQLIEQYQPDVLVFEEVLYSQARLSPLLRRLLVTVNTVAQRAGVATRSHSPLDVKRSLCEGRPTRSGLTRSVCLRFPLLAPYFKREPLMAYWQQMFDAVALGVHAVSHQGTSAAVTISRAGDKSTSL